MKLHVCFYLFLLYLIYCFEAAEFRTRGRNKYASGVSRRDGSKYGSIKGKRIRSERTRINASTRPKLITKQNTYKPIKVLSNSVVIKNSDIIEKFDSDIPNNQSNTLSMDTENHIVKVSSVLHSNHIDMQTKNGGFEVSNSPKYSHVIEIILKNDSNPKLNEKLSGSLQNENDDTVQKLETELDIFSDGLKASETVTESCLGDECIINTEILSSQTFDEGEIDKFSPEKLETSEVSPSENVDSITPLSDFVAASDSQTSSIKLSPEPIDELDKLFGFNEDFEGSGEDFSSLDSQTDESSKDGRLLSFFSQRNASSPACTTPKGESGQCRRIRQCLLSDALNNFNVFLQQLCLIRGVMVGVCCPDNPVIEITNPDENATDSKEVADIKQPPEGCGLNTKTRIVGGTISVPHEWTWMVALMRRNRFYCGGVIINNWYILTAAHCVMGMNVKDLSVRLGEYDFNEHNKHQEDIPISEIKRHAQFVTLTFQHDIALLKMKRSIQYSKFVGSICLPTQKARDYSDVQGTVVGWGTVSFGGAASPILRQVTIPVWKNEDCDRTYLLESISDAFMCAGSPEKGEDACQGDSGGPLMTQNEQGRWEVIGIVSWGRRCGDPTYPGVYTRVTTYLDWILQNTD